MVVFVSIDIGIRNFGVYVERTSELALKNLREKYRKIPKEKQRKTRGKMSPEIHQILDEMYKKSKAIHMDVLNFSPDKKQPALTKEIRLELISYLNSNKEIWDKADTIIIEQQYFSTFTPKGKRNKSTTANVKAIKFGEDTFMWFLINYPYKEIVYFGSMFKTQILGAPPTLTKPQRKKWCDTKTREIAEMRDDTVIQDFLKECKRKKRKTDDGSDGCATCQAYKYRTFIAKF
jgi:hypothetical protein